MSERCVDPECGVVLVAQRRGLRAADLPPGHGVHYGRGLCKASHERARRAEHGTRGWARGDLFDTDTLDEGETA